MGCCLSFLSRLRPSAVTPRAPADSWTSEDERSAWAFLERERQERERHERAEEEDWLEYQREATDAQDFWDSQRGQW